MSLTELISIAGFQLIPYSLSQYFDYKYVVETDYRFSCQEKYSPKRLKRYNWLRIIFLLLGFFPALILHPFKQMKLRYLYRRYMSHLSDAFHVGSDPQLTDTEKRRNLLSKGILINASSDPLDLPDNWYQT